MAFFALVFVVGGRQIWSGRCRDVGRRWWWLSSVRGRVTRGGFRSLGTTTRWEERMASKVGRRWRITRALVDKKTHSERVRLSESRKDQRRDGGRC
ncbi:hypothetical protein F5X68DRAFT_205028 [Plectosphaerella plurivora]|uniref:Secreted protein n=1 Tax=Plectosphaerella plurivora TaxID=936078 RepID=A0A9P8VCU9_9PEZI|nr:hypothetical protein F5X68DRAFT_205028 [Plectosphaerella plurivora]